MTRGCRRKNCNKAYILFAGVFLEGKETGDKVYDKKHYF